VFSAYAEAIVPLLEGKPLFESLTTQIAGRFEHYDDIDASVFKPRIALSWYLNEWIQLRGAWSKGFRAPNLVQSNTPPFERFTNSQVDYTRALTQGQVGDVAVISRFFSDPNLEPENSTNYSLGFTLQPPVIEGLTITLDYWNIEFEGTVGILGRNNEIALDEFLFRTTGVGNPNVVRADPTQSDIDDTAAQNLANGTDFAALGSIIRVNETITNLNQRKVSGIDFNVVYEMPETDIGEFTFRFNGAYLENVSVEPFEGIIDAINDPISGGNFDVDVTGANEVGFETTPKWRFQFSILWEQDEWDAGISGRYVGPTTDTGVVVDVDGEDVFFQVDSFFTMDTFVAYTFDEGALDGFRIRGGVRNLFDQDPPLFDNSAGFSFRISSPRGRQFFLSLTKKF